MYMQLVINIDENLYTRLFDNGDVDAMDMLRACVAICKGKVLPKGHKRLIEVTDRLEQELFGFQRYTGIDEAPYESATKLIDEAPTVVEADEESEE